MIKPTSSLSLTALSAVTALASAAPSSCLATMTVTTTISAPSASCFPTELDCAVLVSHCAAMARHPSEARPYGGTASARLPSSRLVPPPESSASILPVDEHARPTHGCGTRNCRASSTQPAAPGYGASSTVSASSSVAGGITGSMTTMATVSLSKRPSSSRSWHGTETPGGYDFSVPGSASSTAPRFSESVDAATGSVSTSSVASVSSGTTLTTKPKSPTKSSASSTASSPGTPSPSRSWTDEAPSYTKPASYGERRSLKHYV